jgi:hypothetical protein
MFRRPEQLSELIAGDGAPRPVTPLKLVKTRAVGSVVILILERARDEDTSAA